MTRGETLRAQITGVIELKLQKPRYGPECSIALRQAANGFSLTREDHNASYAIILHNIRSYQSAGVVEVVRGKQNAESALKRLEESQRPPDRHEGWRYFLEKTDLKAGTDPAQATSLRQAALERRESKALQESTFVSPSSDTRR